MIRGVWMRSRLVGFLFAALLALIPTAAQSGPLNPDPDLDGDGEVTSRDLFLFVQQWHAVIDSSTPDDSTKFSIVDHFVLSPGSTWTLGVDAKGLTGDGFTWEVLEELVDLGDGRLVRSIRTTGFLTDHVRHLDEDYWSVDESNGHLLFHGIRESFGFSLKGLNLGIDIPPQEFTFEPAIDFGGGDLEIGEVISTTSEISVIADIPPFGEQVISATAFASIHYQEKLPVFTTELGDFTDVIRLNVNIRTRVRFGISNFDFEFLNNNFFLKEGVGIVGIDLDPSPDLDSLLTLIEGAVYIDGAPIAIVPN